MIRWVRSERSDGFVAVELVAGVAVLLLPVALVVATLPTWAERQSAARAIAREVARRAAGDGWCDIAGAGELAATMAANLGLPDGDAAVALGCTPGAVLEPGSSLEVEVRVAMPALRLLAFGDVGGWTWTARHRQPADTYVGVP